MIDTLYRSENLELRRVAAGDGRVQVVTFDHYHDQPGTDRTAFGQDHFAARGITALHLLSRGNDWFQYPETEEVLRLIRAAVEGASRVVAYGSSMGGYAALRFAAAIGADAALALSPQYSLDRRKAGFETRWAQDRRRIRFRHALDGAIVPVPLMVLAYDPRVRPDRLHAARIMRAVPLTPIALPYAGHPVGPFLADVGLLDTLVTTILDGVFDAAALHRAALARRGRSPEWLAQLAAAQPAHRARLAVGLAERAVALAPDRPPILDRLAICLAAAGRFDDALSMHDKALAIEPAVAYRWSLSKTLHAAGDLHRAIAVVRSIQSDAPHLAGYHAWAAKLRRALGDDRGALDDLRQACAHDPANLAYRLMLQRLAWTIRLRRVTRPATAP
jgi:tetratricopeptide (TPR) repeat protein